MAYQAIYRKWRPLVFEDIVGQTHITTTLKNQIINGRISHAYLFCGTRGTGKTTAAKVFARAVNCLNPHDGSPCNECAICRGILDGSIMDVSEIDAASNNGVENIREIREDVNYVATQAKYRVYIIDEVHMLSQGAFNALLKTLEEPPPHVIFILATTEVHKVPETILSRCQRFDFKRIRPSDIVLRMKEIAMGDGLTISDDALHLLARLAEGSMRDGLSILERCVSACGTTLTYENVTAVLGIVQRDLILSITDAIASGDAGNALAAIDRLVTEGKDLNTFCDTLLSHMRDLLVIKVAPGAEQILDYPAEEYVQLKAQAERMPFERIQDAAESLQKARAEAKWLKDPRVVYELCLVKLAHPELDASGEAIAARVSDLEEQLKNGVTVQVQQAPAEKQEKKPEKPKKEPSARLYAPLDVQSLTAETPVVAAARKWDKAAQAIAKRYPFLAGSVLNRKITIDGEGLLLLFSEKEVMLKKIFTTYQKSAEELFQKNVGAALRLKAVFESDVEDHIIDFWAIPSSSQIQAAPSPEPEPEEPVPQTAPRDPLEELEQSFPEIIEYTDESEFINYEPAEDHFEQTVMDAQEEEEEFLDERELNQE